MDAKQTAALVNEVLEERAKKRTRLVIERLADSIESVRPNVEQSEKHKAMLDKLAKGEMSLDEAEKELCLRPR